MADQIKSGGAGTAAARARKASGQALANRIVRGLLRTPLLSHAIGQRLVTLYVLGRTSGRRYTVPVAYTRHQGELLIGTSFRWGHNLATGQPVDIRLKGRRRVADVVALATEPDVVDAYTVIVGHNHAFAKFNKIAFDPSGAPDPHDLHLAWASGARAFRLTPR